MTEDQKKFDNPPAIVPTKPVDLTHGIRPGDFDELNRFATLVHRAHLSPQSFDTPEKIAIGILTNMELGRPIITGLQDLAIINGKCGIYGDASMAMVTASGLMDLGYPKETETGTPYEDSWTFTFTVKRKGGVEHTGRWTWVESKRAGFDNPQLKRGGNDNFSPWRRFTRRMMQWKARNYVMRDVFGDVLKGMKTVEDLHDMDGVIDLAPSGPGSFAPEPTTEDLAAKILNGNVDESISEIDRDLGKAQERTIEPEKFPKREPKPANEIKTPPPKENKTHTFTTEGPTDELLWYDTKFWIKTKTSGFTAFCIDNAERMNDIAAGAVCVYKGKSMLVLAAMHRKWEGIHPDKPFPGNPVANEMVVTKETGVQIKTEVYYDPNENKPREPPPETKPHNGNMTPKQYNLVLKDEFPVEWDQARHDLGFGMLAVSDEAADRWNKLISQKLDEG